MIRFVMAEPARYSGASIGDPFPSLGVPKWSFRLDASHFTTGATASVVIEGSPTPHDDATWTTVHDFGAVTAKALTVARSYASGDEAADFDPVGFDVLWLRARIYDVSGDVALSVLGEALVLDVEDAADLALLPQELREWKDGRARTVASAAEDVRAYLGAARDYYGRLFAYADDPDFYPALRFAIAAQAAHLLARARQTQKEKPLAAFSEDAVQKLRPYRTAAAGSWRGR